MRGALRKWAGPLALGAVLFALSFAIEVSWWLVAGCAVCYAIGYADPWDSKGNPRR